MILVQGFDNGFDKTVYGTQRGCGPGKELDTGKRKDQMACGGQQWRAKQRQFSAQFEFETVMEVLRGQKWRKQQPASK
jgi:hypothetical protein